VQSVGERLKQARVAAGLSLRELAQRVGLSAMAISKYENDQVVPGSEMLIRLGDALGVKAGYFHRPLQVEVRRPAYRRHSRLGKKAQGVIEGGIKEFLERYLQVEEVFEPERVPCFEWPPSCSGTLGCVEQAEEFAAGLRQDWGLGEDPIANLCETLEDRGVKVVLLAGLGDGFDGYSCWANGSVPVVAGRSGEEVPGDRLRFTLAHELGHLLLEEHVADGVDVERACHRFAGALLVPETAARREVGGARGQIGFGELLSLKHKWGLSMGAWLYRLADLNVITASRHQAFRRVFSANGWHKREPGDPVEPERTERFERLVERAVAEDIISVSRAADFLGKPLIQVRREMAWPKGEACVS